MGLWPFGLLGVVWPFMDSRAPVFWPLVLKLVEVPVLLFAALAIHELAHCAMARALGVKCGIRGRPPGHRAHEGMLYWLADVDATLTRRKEWLVTLAGPASNLVCYPLGFVALRNAFTNGLFFLAVSHAMLFAACSITVAVTSLMPFRLEGAISDGERILAMCFEKRP